MWDLIVSVPDHCLSFYFTFFIKQCFGYDQRSLLRWEDYLQLML